MGAWNVRAFGAAVFVLCAAFIPRPAHAATEYCPAVAGSSHLFGGAHAGLYSFVVSAASERDVAGEMFAETNLGWFRFLFGPSKIASDHVTYRTPTGIATIDRYVSPVEYVQFPPDVTMVARTWVSRVRAVPCEPPAGGGLQPERRQTLDTIRLNPSPFALDALPPAGTNVTTAIASSSPGDESCSRPFTDATVTEPYAPDLQKRPEADRLVALVEVAVSARGTLDDARISLSSGDMVFDAAALRAARRSKYAAGTALCRAVPGTYVFHAEYF